MIKKFIFVPVARAQVEPDVGEKCIKAKTTRFDIRMYLSRVSIMTILILSEEIRHILEIRFQKENPAKR
jgi:hypothetical protein